MTANTGYDPRARPRSAVPGSSSARPAVVPLAVGHWPQVEAIYAEGIATGHATFEAEPPTWDAFDRGKLPDLRWVAVDDSGTVLGWAAASRVSDRCAYLGVVEHSIYVAGRAQGRGVGRVLLDHLAAATEAAGIWTIQAGVFPENTPSLALHRAAGYRTVGTRTRVGKMTHGPLAGQWRDVVMIERRSTVSGTD
ncbi:MAG: GNAT family N-acetyltransferase [Angustibacter sp.]